MSLHEREAAAHHTAVTIAGDHVGLQKQNVTHAQHKKQDNDIPVSGDAIPSPNEIAKRAEALGLSTQEVTLYCWEPAADNVKKGIENGGAFQLFDPVYRFGPELPAASAHRSVAWIAPQQQPMTAAALMLSKERDSKELRWWWYNPAPEEVQHVHEDEDDVDNKPAPLPPMQLPTEKNLPSKPAAKTSPQRQKTVHVQTASANSNANDNGNIYLQPPNMMVGMGTSSLSP